MMDLVNLFIKAVFVENLALTFREWLHGRLLWTDGLYANKERKSTSRAIIP